MDKFTGAPREEILRRSTRRTLRRAGQIITWPLSGHLALALATGLVCGTIASHYTKIIVLAPSYAALAGTLVIYPVVVAAWRLMDRSGGRR